MYVKDHMTKEPVTITEDVKISKAVDIMSKGHFHRLPIVDEDGRLIGLITGGLVTEKSGANATSLSIYELNYLLSKTTVRDIMLTDIKTIGPEAFIEEAAQKMLDEGISVLPVVDEDNQVVGIITEKDIFQAFTDLLGYKHQGTRFVFQCDDRPGFFAGIAQLLAENEANMEAMAVYHTKSRGTEAVVKATGEISVKSMVDILVNAGYKLNNVTQTTKFGTIKNFDL
ncbi:MAG: CBS domain-containing protein [Lachnospiraceae bacterium]|jgi:acetoin utilization protein AcuB|nr:CBS domain-containing protein [Lachnospiraceae bacterium]